MTCGLSLPRLRFSWKLVHTVCSTPVSGTSIRRDSRPEPAANWQPYRHPTLTTLRCPRRRVCALRFSNCASAEKVPVGSTPACRTAEKVSTTFWIMVRSPRLGPHCDSAEQFRSWTQLSAVPQKKYQRCFCFIAMPQTKC